jgi:hypothetical protein
MLLVELVVFTAIAIVIGLAPDWIAAVRGRRR